MVKFSFKMDSATANRLSSVISARKPTSPNFTPRMGMSCSPIQQTAFKKVPSPPRTKIQERSGGAEDSPGIENFRGGEVSFLTTSMPFDRSQFSSSSAFFPAFASAFTTIPILFKISVNSL